MAVGPINERSMAFKADGAVTQHRVAIQGAADGEAKLPTSDNPATAIGVFREGRADDKFASVQQEGIEYVEAGGTCTRGKFAAILDGGKVQDVAVNATPALQYYIGQFLESGTDGQLVRVEIRPGHIVS